MTVSRPRDERGWRIPFEGTKSWYIYQLLLLDFTPKEITRLYKADEISSSIKVLVYNIQNPDRHNGKANTWYKKNSERINNKAKKIRQMRPRDSVKYSAYVVKLVKILGISYTEALEEERKFLEKAK